MNMCSAGSALIALLILLSAGIICSIGLWKNSLRLVDLMRAKEVYYQYYYAAQGLLLCGCSVAAQNKLLLSKQSVGACATITFSSWPITDTKNGSGSITITVQTPTTLNIESRLQVNKQDVCSLRCTMQMEGDDAISHSTISDWRVTRD